MLHGGGGGGGGHNASSIGKLQACRASTFNPTELAALGMWLYSKATAKQAITWQRTELRKENIDNLSQTSNVGLLDLLSTGIQCDRGGFGCSSSAPPLPKWLLGYSLCGLPYYLGTYVYTSDLLHLQRQVSSARPVTQCLLAVSTPLRVQEWATLLRYHPETELLSGISQGFRVGFKATSKLRSAKTNFPSVQHHSEVVKKYLDAELALGRMLGPFDPQQLPGVHISSFGVIPKQHQVGRWRLIVDLSSPEGASVNDGIPTQLYSLKNIKVDEIAKSILRIGMGTEVAKMDIKSAYHIVPVHPGDRWLLGMRWRNQLFVDTALPFGLRSAPKNFHGYC